MGHGFDEYAEDDEECGAGRGPAERALRDWWQDTGAAPLCLLTGAGGSGKTTLLHRVARAHEATTQVFPSFGRDSPVLVDATGASLTALTTRLAAGTGREAATPEALAARLTEDAAGGAGERLTVVLTGVHAALPGAARLVPVLLAVPGVRIVAEVRDPDAVPELACPAAVRVDLDDPALTDRAGFAAWYAGLAAGAPPLPADRVHPSPGIARLAAALSPAAAAGAGPGPAGIAAAWWADRTAAERAALRTLAAARGPLGLSTWRALHRALHPEDPGAGAAVDAAAGRLAPQEVRFLLPVPEVADAASGDGVPSGAEVFRHLRAMVPRLPGGGADWEHAPRYALERLIAHAPSPEAAAELASDPAFLARAAPSAVDAALSRGAGEFVPAGVAAAWREASGNDWLVGADVLAQPLRAALVAHEPAAARRVPYDTRYAPPHTPVWGRRDLAVAAMAWGAPGTPYEGLLVAVGPAGGLASFDPVTGVPGPCPGGPGGGPAGGRPRGLAHRSDGTFGVLGADGVVRPESAGAARTTASCLGGGGRDDGLVVAGTESGGVRIEGAPGAPRLCGHVLTAVTAARPGGALVVSGMCVEGCQSSWESGTGRTNTFARFHWGTVPSIAAAVTDGGRVTLALADGGPVVKVMDHVRRGGTPVRAPHPVTAVALAPDGFLVTAGPAGLTGWRAGG